MRELKKLLKHREKLAREAEIAGQKAVQAAEDAKGAFQNWAESMQSQMDQINDAAVLLRLSHFSSGFVDAIF